MKAKGPRLCCECEKMMHGCRASIQDTDGNPLAWVCPKCWRELDYERFLYKHNEGKEEKVNA
jgi:hypothetical protein